MYIGLAALAFTFFAFFGEKINKMDFNLTRAELLLLIFLWGLTVLANRNQFYRLWGKFRHAPFILGIRNRFYKRRPLFPLVFLKAVLRQQEEEKSAQKMHDEWVKKASEKNYKNK